MSDFINTLKNEFAGYNLKGLKKDTLAGITVAAVALPLALAFGVSSGADAAAGLITAILAGLIIGSLSGASYQISGPTGAMTAILITLVSKYGLQGVFFAGLLSGIILLAAGIFKVGRIINIIPLPVITGFTSGIAVIIALGQLDNLFGVKGEGENALFKFISYFSNGFDFNLQSILLGLGVIVFMVLWPKSLSRYVPASLAAIVVTVVLNLIFSFDVAVVGEIPKTLLPSNRLDITKLPLNNINELFMPALSIAALAMIESLLCGASAGRMSGEKLNGDRELIAQGIGNIVIPIFGGVPATAAIARTSVAIKAGCKTRLTGIVHSAVLLLSMLVLSPVMSKIPLASLAGVLIVTAWRMNEWGAIKFIFKKRLKTAILQFSITMAATVLLDLTFAIVIGIVFSAFMFIVSLSDIEVTVSDVDKSRLKEDCLSSELDHTGTKIVYVTGPIFFASSEKLSGILCSLTDTYTIILSMRGVPSIDASGAQTLLETCHYLKENKVTILFAGVQPKVKRMLDRSDITIVSGEENFYWSAKHAILRQSAASDTDFTRV